MAKPITITKHVWPWFALYIRLRDTDENGLGPCCSCGKILPWTGPSTNAGHYIAKGGCPSLYLDERNVHLQCKSCNGPKNGNQYEYLKRTMIPKYGPEIHDILTLECNIPKQYKQFQLHELEVKYRTMAFRLADKKGLNLLTELPRYKRLMPEHGELQKKVQTTGKGSHLGIPKASPAKPRAKRTTVRKTP